MAAFARDELSIRVIRRILNNKINAPTFVVLYTNFMLGAFWLLGALGGPESDQNALDYILILVSSLGLLLASSVAAVGTYQDNHKLISYSSMVGYIAWCMAFMMWLADDGKFYNFTVPVFVIPMIAFFAYSHLRRVIEK